ncbi:MAG: aspartyl protease family protein [Deltaproteobacteria bacterium]|nr:aspartyl protease family protein [Deltaproteobacteria bacterium]
MAAGVLARRLARHSTPSGLDDAQTAWVDVQRAPRDPSRWAALGDSLGAVDDLNGAEQAYRTALLLGGDDPAIRGRFGFLLYSAGREQDALVELTAAQEARADLPLLSSTIAELRARLAKREASAAPSPPPPPPPPEPPAVSAALTPTPAPVAPAPDASVIPVTVTALGTFVVTVTVNDQPLALVVDTGASITAISRDAALTLGLAIDPDHTLHAFTANGPTIFSTTVLGSLALGGVRLEGMRAAICDQCAGPVAAGLLGLDAQAGLGLQLDIQTRTLRFMACAR